MPSPPHIVRSPALLGINESTRPELVDFGSKNLRNENIRPTRVGEAGPRFGFAALDNARIDGADSAGGLRLFADRNTILKIGSTGSETYDPKSAKWAALLGRSSEASVRLIDFPSLGTTNYIEDVAVTNGYACIAWSVTGSGGAVFAAITNVATGATVVVPTQVGTLSTAPCLVVNGNVFILVCADAVGATVHAYKLDTTSAASINSGWTAMTDLATDYQTATYISVCSLSTYAALAYVNTSGGASQLTVKTFTAAGGVTATQTIATGATPAFTDIQGSTSDTLWVAWNEALNVKIRGLNPADITLTALATTATIITVASAVTTIGIQSGSTAGQGRLFVSDNTLVTMKSHTRGFKTTAGAAATNGSQITVYGVFAAGRPAFSGARYYVPVYVADADNLQKQVVLVDWTDDVTFLRPVAVPAPGLAVVNTGASHRRCHLLFDTSTNLCYFGLAIARSAVSSATALAEFNFNSPQASWQAAAFGNSLYFNGGVTSYSDGRRIAEAGFLVRPSLPTTSTSGTGITAATGWRYICVYEEVDADGNWHVSGLSDPSASTGAVADKTVTVSTLPLTVSSRINASGANASGVRVAFYRTLDGAVAPYYRLGTTINDTSTSAVTYADSTSDAVLALNSKLYSQPGVLGTTQDRRPPPSFACLTSYNGMLVGASGSDVWYSGQNVSGEGAWFNPIFQVPVPGDGDIIALAVMDGTLFVFKRGDVYTVVGDPPSDNGAVGGLGTPRRLSVDAGAISPITCTTALGIFYQGARGIELLTRKQAVQWIGQDVEETTASYPIITSMTVDSSAEGSYLLIELAASTSSGLVTGTGRTLVFDLSVNDWISTDRRKNAQSAVDAPSQSACMVYTASGWRYAWLSGGYVHVEDRTTYLDLGNTFVAPLVETGWINAFQNEQRVWRVSVLFERYDAAGLQVEVAYDYGDYDSADDVVWTEDDTEGQRQLEFSPSPRGESMKFRITTTTPATLGTGQGIGVFGVALDLREKQGPTKGTIRLDPALRK